MPRQPNEKRVLTTLLRIAPVGRLSRRWPQPLALMKHFCIIIILLLVGVSLGCALSTTPKDDAGFGAVNELKSLAGCYRNRGEGESVRYLSAVIWPKEQLAHEQILAIKVVFEEPRSLRVSALGPKGTTNEEIFVEGTDFHLSTGLIQVQSDTVASFAYPAGNVFIGAGHQSQSLGLDPRGDARMQESAIFAGTAFLVIPIAGNVSDSYRFPRLQEPCNDR